MTVGAYWTHADPNLDIHIPPAWPRVQYKPFDPSPNDERIMATEYTLLAKLIGQTEALFLAVEQECPGLLPLVQRVDDTINELTQKLNESHVEVHPETATAASDIF